MKVKPLTRLDLHQALNYGAFDHAIILTYTFEPLFFEEYCLANLAGLHNCKSISVCLDRSTYEKIIVGSHSDRPKLANRRYLLHPITVPGTFHPKLVMLTSSNKGLLLIGSANFTRPGLTANAELVGTYEFKAKDKEQFAPLFRSAFAMTKAISGRWPARNLTSNLQEMERDSPWLENSQHESEGVDLISNLNQPLLSQLIAKADGEIRSVSLVSRYFDETPHVVEELLRLTAASRITIFTQNRCTNLPPSWLQHPAVKSGRLEFHLAEYSSDERDQPLHGKLFAMHTSKRVLLAFGSANCTTPALLESAHHSNVETLITVQLSAREAKAIVPQLLDPEGNSQRLTDPKKLISVPLEKKKHEGESLPIKIEEAEANGDQILIWLAEPLNRSELKLKVEFSAERFVRVPVEHANLSEFSINIGEEAGKRLAQGSAIIGFEDRAGMFVSNRLFVTNLMDLQTGLSARKSRYVKEAEQNSVGLLSVLLDLRSGTDEDALRTFLTFCDIPLILGPRPGWRPLAKGAGDIREGMRSLGQQNFNIALTLHELALRFCERHFRKLRRHTADRKINSAPNFLHIALAIGGVLESQIERALSGLEARTRVTVEEWSAFRNICDTYFLKYRELNALIWEDYLSKLIREFPQERIREAFEPELHPLHDLSKQMVQFRERVEKLRTSKCLLHSNREMGTPFAYFGCIFGERRWPTLKKEMDEVYTLIASVIVGNSKPDGTGKSAA
jgi:hypothetical protein